MNRWYLFPKNAEIVVKARPASLENMFARTLIHFSRGGIRRMPRPPEFLRLCVLPPAVSAVLFSGTLTAPLQAQADGPPLWTRHSIHSEILGEERFLRISVPGGHDLPQMSTTHYPVLIVLDAEVNAYFAAVLAVARALGSISTPVIPSLIVVGVESQSATRYRDFTLPAPDGSLERVDGGGGAPAFLQFLAGEVLPYLDSRYRVHPFTVLSGHSLAGFFAQWAFGEAPAFINAAVVSSPTPLEQERIIDIIAARGVPGRLYMASGMAEVYLDAEAQSFAEALRRRELAGLAFEYERIPDAAHLAASLLSTLPGLRFIFRPVSLGGYQVEFASYDDRMMSTFSSAFDSTRAAFLHGAAQLGLPERLPFGFLNAESTRYQNAMGAPLRLRLCEELRESYPHAYHGFECAGDALVWLDRLPEAIDSYRRAFELANAAGNSADAARIASKAVHP